MWINYRIRVTLTDTIILIGIVLVFDKHMNLVLSETEKHRRIKIKNKKMIKKEKNFLGLILVRWDSVFIINRKPSPWK